MKPAFPFALLALSVLPYQNAFALEGALGRPVSGTAINPYAAIVPPAPGFVASITEI